MKDIEKLNRYLCPPGNGVFTVHTAKENKESLHSVQFKTKDPKEVEKIWREDLSNFKATKLPILMGLCIDTGGGIQRGANWGPLFIREHIQKSIGHPEYFDIGDVRVIPHLLHDKYLNEQTIRSCQEALYDGEDLKVSGLSIAEEVCDILISENKKVFSLGGDHSVSYPVVKSWIKGRRAAGKKVAVIHFDAHTDLMPKRLGIDICFASWAYHMIELLEKPSHLLQFGIRSSGQPKEHWESKLGVQQFWASEFNTTQVEEKTLKYLKDEEIDEVYISFDIDALDAQYASSTGTPEVDGLEPHRCIQLIEKIAEVCHVTGGDVVEVAPFVHSALKSKLAPEPETTVESASLISRKILEVMSK
jgi:agmatinase